MRSRGARFRSQRWGSCSQNLSTGYTQPEPGPHGWAFPSHTGRSEAPPHTLDRGFCFGPLSTCPQVLLLLLKQTIMFSYGELLDRKNSTKVQNVRFPGLQDKWGV
jgi:hypothetical protein